MKLLSFFLCAALVAAPVAAQGTKAKTPAPPKPSAKGGRVITITGTDNMKFDVTTITAKPGERLRVVLKAVGALPKIAMAHNFVLLKAGANVDEINKAAMTARDTDFIPPAFKAQIHAFTPLAGAGETVEVSFAAPTTPGTYPYICSFPGHYTMGMKGNLIVK